MTQRLSLVLLATLCLALPVFAQQLGWQTKAGGKLAFEVASIRLDTSSKFTPPNMDVSAEDVFTPTDGLFTASLPLINYNTFAYKT